jgi:hypothetical protein
VAQAVQAVNGAMGIGPRNTITRFVRAFVVPTDLTEPIRRWVRLPAR